MTAPLISYVTYNRLGLTARNLMSILSTPEDFEMHIVDNNSKDNTWEFIQDIRDERIKSKTRFPINAGPIYSLNFNLTKRRPDQYFITVDSDIYIKTKDWISRFMGIFQTFPEVGLLGVQRTAPYIPIYPPVILKSRNGLSYLELQNAKVGEILDFVHGCCMCLRPELVQQIGYWSEENCFGDAEICPRVHHYTPFKVGFMTDANYTPMIDFAMDQVISCSACTAQKYCKLDKVGNTCFSVNKNNNGAFVEKARWKYLQSFAELAEGKRTAYCASILDPASMQGHLYHSDWATENFNFYIQNSV